jgi:hypothetical protein
MGSGLIRASGIRVASTLVVLATGVRIKELEHVNKHQRRHRARRTLKHV